MLELNVTTKNTYVYWIRRVIWCFLFVNIFITINYALFTVPNFSLNVFGIIRGDHLLHALAFFSLSLPAFALLGFNVRSVIVLISSGIGVELLQILRPPRQPSLTDIVADIFGILIAAVVVLTVRYAARFVAKQSHVLLSDRA